MLDARRMEGTAVMTDFLRYSDEDARIVGVLYENSQRLLAKWLFEARVTLCDLLHGRAIRAAAWRRLEDALDIESHGAPALAVSELVDSAANLEWIATITERGQVYWGERKNRTGKSPEDMGA